MGLFRDNETNNLNGTYIHMLQHNLLKGPTGGRIASWLFYNVAEELNLGLRRINPASGQGST